MFALSVAAIGEPKDDHPSMPSKDPIAIKTTARLTAVLIVAMSLAGVQATAQVG